MHFVLRLGLQNGGTRTFSMPQGGDGAPATQTETMGNALAVFGAKIFETALEAGKVPLSESSAPSGRYPKHWDLPSWQELLRRPGVTFRDMDMCAFGLGPPDQQNTFWVHRTRLCTLRMSGFWEQWVRYCPGLSAAHRHEALKGQRPGADISRCQEAEAYAAGVFAKQ